MKIHAFDIDGVVTTSCMLVDCIKREYPSFRDEHLTDYAINKSLLDSGHIASLGEFSSGVFFSKYGEDILAGSKISPGFVDYYKMVIASGDEVHFITARNEEDESYTQKLFKRCGIKYSNVHHTGDPKEKDWLITELGVTDFYEDNLETGLRVAKLGSLEVVIVDALYNRMEKFPYKNMKRIKSWGDLK